MANQSKFNKKYNQGFYNLMNPDKYKGDPGRVIYRSSWEFAFCKYLDTTESILKWSCEQPIITY